MMIKNIFNLVFIIVILLLVLFHRRVMRRLDFKRPRDLFGLFSLIFLFIILQNLLSNGFIVENIRLFIAGVIIGVPVAIFTDYFTLKKVRDNILYPNSAMRKYILLLSILIGLPIGIWAAHKGLTNETFSFMVGFVFVGSIIMFGDIMRYEKKHGPLYIKKKPKHN